MKKFITSLFIGSLVNYLSTRIASQFIILAQRVFYAYCNPSDFENKSLTQ